MSTSDERSYVEPLDAFAEWFESEVPGIVTGLQQSGRINDRVADSAWTLIAEGHSRVALELVMDTVDAA
ncbi:hypothetical protein C474_07902 [Halogeometricum pallidum JCM 14848]|uniref:Uncharacterized protein n=1 Tax=Halogeometricum pallidum JCM 14848 TaxID=1227487 RepID=M0DAL9_HALPD|nr:hypothetical protein [Halogeometricum pallidum]ELZ31792.1 hypothetical protein C474_07902 [Halogeometricum pallidum JCM 14848]